MDTKDDSLSPAAAKALRRRRYRQLRAVLLALMIGGVAAIATVWVIGVYTVGIEKVLSLQASLSPYLHVLRTSVLVGVVAFWPRLIGRLADWLLMGPAFTRAMIAWRWRAALWIVLFELVVVYEVPFEFLRRLQGGAL